MAFKLPIQARQIIEAIGLISIVGSLLFVGLQMHQAQQISSAEQDLTRAEISMALRANQNRYIEIWHQGNAGKPLDELSSIIYRNLLLDSWDRAEALSQARTRIGSDSNLAIREFAVFLFENPGAKATWIDAIQGKEFTRNLLGYNSPGYNLRRNIVFEDLELLAQQMNNSKSNTLTTLPTKQNLSEQVGPNPIKENLNNN